MPSRVLLTALTILSVASAFPRAAPQSANLDIEADTTATSTISATFSYTITQTEVVPLPTEPPTTSSSSPKTTYTATELYARRPGAPIDLLPFQAAGYFFRLGGFNAAYCPTFAENLGACGNTNFTGLNDCSLSVVVPGGQSIYLAPDGSLRYTAAHSQYMVPGSVQCPLSFTGVEDSDTSKVILSGFNATGFMACPMLSTTKVRQHWQVYANTLNATLPLESGNSSQCWPFDVFGIVRELEHPTAWQYV